MSTVIITQLITKGAQYKTFSLQILAVFLLSLLSLMFISPLHADIYSWTDNNGVKHFSNKPPPKNTNSVVEVKREHVYNEAADEQRWELERVEWDALLQKLKSNEDQEEEVIEADAEKKGDAKSIKEKIERERYLLQAEIARLEKMPASSFSGQLDGKRASISYYRARIQMLEGDPKRYFSSP